MDTKTDQPRTRRVAMLNKQWLALVLALALLGWVRVGLRLSAWPLLFTCGGGSYNRDAVPEIKKQSLISAAETPPAVLLRARVSVIVLP